MADQEKIYREAMSAGHSAAWDLEWARAAAHYQEALQAKPQDYQALTSLGLAFYELHRFDDALKKYTEAAKVHPEEPVPWEKMAQIYERKGNISEAIRAALQAADRFMKRKEFKRGIDNYLRVTRLDPDHLLAHTHLALIYDRLQQIDRAIEEYLAVAALLQRQGKIKEATQAAQKAINLAPNDPKARQALAAIQRGTLLPKPKRPRGGTNPLRIAKIRQNANATSQENADAPDDTAQNQNADPIAAAQQRALTLLAETLFEEAETQHEPGEKRSGGLDVLVQGMTNPQAREQQRSRILLLLGQVVDMQTQGNYAQAAEELLRAVSAGLDHAGAYFDLGFLLAKSGNYAEAIRYLQKSVYHPDFALASHLLLAQASLQLDKKVEAAQHYLEALRIADTDTVSKEEADKLGHLYEPLIAQIANGQANDETLDRIAENVEQLLLQPDWRQRVQAAREQIAQESHTTGNILPLADMLMEANSGRIVTTLSRVHNLLANGAWGAALEETQLALAYAPAYLPLHTLMADILLERGMVNVAEEKYLMIARTYLARGSAQQAIDLYKKALEINPTHLEAHVHLVEALIGQNRLEEAIAHYMEMAESYYQLADLQQAQTIYERALRLARRLAKGRQWQLQILRRMADLAEQQLDWRQAILIYEQIRTIEPQDKHVRAKLITLRLKMGQTKQATQELDEFIAYLTRKGNLTQALALIKELLETHPKSGELHMRLGQVYTTLEQRSEAIRAFDTAGECFLDAKQPEDAIQAIEAILALQPPDAEAYREALAQLHAELA